MEGCKSSHAFWNCWGIYQELEQERLVAFLLVTLAIYLLHWKVEKCFGWNPEAGMQCLQKSSSPRPSFTVKETEAQRGETPWPGYPVWQQKCLEWSPFSLSSRQFLLPLLSVRPSPPANLPFKENTESRGVFLKIDSQPLASPWMPLTCRFLGFTQTC